MQPLDYLDWTVTVQLQCTRFVKVCVLLEYLNGVLYDIIINYWGTF